MLLPLVSSYFGSVFLVEKLGSEKLGSDPIKELKLLFEDVPYLL
jgi:hypothetical protein